MRARFEMAQLGHPFTAWAGSTYVLGRGRGKVVVFIGSCFVSSYADSHIF